MLDILTKIGIKNAPEDYGAPLIKNATPVPLSVENYHPLNPVKGKRIGFVDGGNNTIYLAPGQAIYMVRLYYSIFVDGHKEEYGRYTYIVDNVANAEENKFELTIYDVDNSRLFPENMEIDMEEIDERDKIKAVGAYLRRMGEWLLSARIISKVDILVRDGSLQTGAKREYEYADKLFESVKDNVIVGFSKTCSLLTTRGYSLVASLHHLAKKNKIKAPWYYHPIARGITTIKGDMFAVKLHPFSEYVFRVEVYPEKYAEEALGALVPMANDPIMMGYPYGLLDADINARISDEEAKTYRQVIYNHADPFTLMQARAMDAHDRISEVK
jgi:hypothetical protein